LFRFQYGSYCDYTNPRNGAPWFCEMPPSKRYTRIINLIYGTFEKKGSGLFTYVNFDEICENFGCQIKKNIERSLPITVNQSPNALTPSDLPPCETEFFSSRSLDNYDVKGYFEQKRWNSLVCSKTDVSTLQLQSCLQNKLIFFLGDSTIRQFFFLLANKLDLEVKGESEGLKWHYPKIAREPMKIKTNVTLYYRAHGPPLFNLGPLCTKPYLSDSIIDLPGGKDVYVIFNIGVHFLHFHPNMYIHRLKGIKNAISKHLKTYPDTKFILRGLNVIENTKEWVIYRFEVILRNIFQNMRNVLYLNLWGLTTVWPIKRYHPDDTVLAQELAHMFSHVCGKK